MKLAMVAGCQQQLIQGSTVQHNRMQLYECNYTSATMICHLQGDAYKPKLATCLGCSHAAISATTDSTYVVLCSRSIPYKVAGKSTKISHDRWNHHKWTSQVTTLALQSTALIGTQTLIKCSDGWASPCCCTQHNSQPHIDCTFSQMRPQPSCMHSHRHTTHKT